jgi:HEPN domain-containing protein
MKTITREWVDKAEGDFAIAEREIEVKLNPNYDAVCFHCQQCAEKYLKERMQEAEPSSFDAVCCVLSLSRRFC